MALFKRKKEPAAPLQEDVTGMMDIPYLVLTVLLTAVGVLMMFSASFPRAKYDTGNSAYYFVRQAGFALAGIFIMLLVSRLNYFIWYRLALFILLAAAVLLLILAANSLLLNKLGWIKKDLPLCKTVNGASRWVRLGIDFQPSEVAKLGMILTFGAMMSVWQDKMGTFKYGVLPYVVILGVLGGLLMLEPHFSATIILLVVGAIMMLIGGTKKRWFLIGFGIILVVAAVYLVTHPYAMQRILSWRNPEADAQNSGYQAIQSKYAIGSGGFLGLGFGRGRQKYMYLPEEHNDYIFSIVCEELGFVGAVGIILLFILLIIRGYWIALHARDRFSTLVAAGLTTKLAIQVFFNIGVVTTFLPSTGISFPLFSYGGTALLLQLFEMGIMLSISRWSVNKESWKRRRANA